MPNDDILGRQGRREQSQSKQSHRIAIVRPGLDESLNVVARGDEASQPMVMGRMFDWIGGPTELVLLFMT
jgi:hypothetical protein